MCLFPHFYLKRGKVFTLIYIHKTTKKTFLVNYSGLTFLKTSLTKWEKTKLEALNPSTLMLTLGW